MDNITHTLIGVTLARGLQGLAGLRKRAEPTASASEPAGAEPSAPASAEPSAAAVPSETDKSAARDAFWAAILWISVLGNNLPDLDFLIPNFTGSKKLHYLLHHRGFTHTLLLVPVFAIVAAALGSRLGKSGFRRNWLPFLGLGVLSTLMHIAADFPNDYGVHPFYPFNARWIYGDFIFIIEPYLTFAMLPLAFVTARTRIGKVVCGVLAVGFLGLLWFGPFVPKGIALAVTSWAILHFAMQWRWRTAGLTWAALIFVYAGFFSASRAARNEVRTWFSRSASEESIIQLVSTPAPANPFCWKIVTVGSSGDFYRGRIGVVSLAPQWVDPHTCHPRLSGARTAPLRDTDPDSDRDSPRGLGGNERLFWMGEYEASLSEFKYLAENHCEFAAMLRYLRAPYWVNSGDALIVGDLRYDMTPALDFADEKFAALPQSCPRWLPPWEPPVEDLLE